MKGKPWFAVSIAVVENGQPIAGVVHAPALNETYAATLDGPATLNGVIIEPSATDRVWKARPCWATPRCSPTRPGASRGRRCVSRAATRSPTACAWSPPGAFDAAIALSPKSEWDVAAADLICRRAGAWAVTTKAAISPIIAPFRWFRAWFAPIGRLRH
jgi:myo-inositol-1(or 4)-monophosphatase